MPSLKNQPLADPDLVYATATGSLAAILAGGWI